MNAGRNHGAEKSGKFRDLRGFWPYASGDLEEDYGLKHVSTPRAHAVAARSGQFLVCLILPKRHACLHPFPILRIWAF
jgi:hypothetical protein